MANGNRVYVILASGEIDLIEEGTEIQCAHHVKWLKKQGHDVKVRWFSSWADANAFEDKCRGY